MNPAPKVNLPFKWVPGHGARRPLLPSERRITQTGTQRMLPAARADMERPRPLTPWMNLASNDWRGIKA